MYLLICGDVFSDGRGKSRKAGFGINHYFAFPGLHAGPFLLSLLLINTLNNNSADRNLD